MNQFLKSSIFQFVLIMSMGVFLLVTFASPKKLDPYAFPLSQNDMGQVSERVGFNWNMEKTDSIDAGNRNFFYKNDQYSQMIIVTSMQIEDKRAFRLINKLSPSHETDMFNKEELSMFFELTCLVNGISGHDDLFKSFQTYLNQRASDQYGNAIWTKKIDDNLIRVLVKPSSVYVGKYQLQTISVENLSFLIASRDQYLQGRTDRFEKNKVLYRVSSISEMEAYASQVSQISHFILDGQLDTLEQADRRVVESIKFDGTPYSVYEKDYYTGQLSDDAKTIDILIPNYIVYADLVDREKSSFSITYYPENDIYILD